MEGTSLTEVKVGYNIISSYMKKNGDLLIPMLAGSNYSAKERGIEKSVS